MRGVLSVGCVGTGTFDMLPSALSACVSIGSPSLVPQAPIREHVDRGSGNIVYLNSGMWHNQSDRLVCN